MAHFKVVSWGGGVTPPIQAKAEAALGAFQGFAWTIAENVVDYLKSITPVRTGTLRDMATSWDMRVFGLGSFTFRVGWRKQDFPGVFYAPYVDRGTGTYVGKSRIYPISAKRLAWKRDDMWVSAQSIPGQKGQKLLMRTHVFAIKQIQKAFAAGVGAGWKR